MGQPEGEPDGPRLVSALRGSRFVLASLAIHVAGGLVVLAVRKPPEGNRKRTISVEVRKREPLQPIIAAAPRKDASAIQPMMRR